MVNIENFERIRSEIASHGAQLVAVSKTKPLEDIRTLYDYGQLIFGENYVQELVAKQKELPDADWHFIGHLQSNKVRLIAPFVSLIHGVDSMNLLSEINRQAAKNKRVINCLLQIYIAEEETKFGLSYEEAAELMQSQDLKTMQHVSVIGLMGMATNTENENQIRKEFRQLKLFFDQQKEFAKVDFKFLSMGMTADYKIALQEGSNLIRIGSAIFGNR